MLYEIKWPFPAATEEATMGTLNSNFPSHENTSIIPKIMLGYFQFQNVENKTSRKKTSPTPISLWNDYQLKAAAVQQEYQGTAKLSVPLFNDST